MKIKTTYEELFNFWNLAAQWRARDKANEKTKLGYAIGKLEPRVKKKQEIYANGLEEINIDECEVDDKGRILKEDDEYQFTKEGLKRRNKRRQEFWESECELEVYYATDIPDDLTVVERDAFEGFVIRPSGLEVEVKWNSGTLDAAGPADSVLGRMPVD